MRFTSHTPSDGVTEQSFTLDGLPGVLWTPEDACGTRPLILVGHGGGLHKTAPGTVSRARRFAAEGFAVVAIDAPHHGDRPKDEEFGRMAAGMRAGMAAGMHSHLSGQAVADWQAVLGLLGVYGLAQDAARITVPVQFLVQWDDQTVSRDQSLALFDALAWAEKTLHANPGGHGDVPSSEVDSLLRFFARFFARHLS